MRAFLKFNNSVLCLCASDFTLMNRHYAVTYTGLSDEGKCGGVKCDTQTIHNVLKNVQHM